LIVREVVGNVMCLGELGSVALSGRRDGKHCS
jgi:hypothetical protein